MVNQVWGKHVKVVTGDQDTSKQVSKNEWNENVNRKGLLGFSAETIASASSVTIPDDSSNDVSSFIKLSGTTSVDTLVTTNTSDGDLLFLITTGSVTLNNTSSPSSAGDIKLLGDANKDLSTTVPTILIRVGNFWYEYGGSETNALNDIGDVVITSVANEDVLAYDSTTSKWINQTADESGRVTASSTTTFTNKTIDQDGTGNSITNLANASIKASAGIDATKIADGTVTSTEFQYINTLSSNAQTQITAKQDALTFGIADGNVTKCDGNVNDNDFIRINGTEQEGLSAAEVKSAIMTIGIADDNVVEIDSASVAANDFAKFTANGLEGRSYTEVKTDLSLSNVENTAISTFAGTSNIVTVGTIGTGTWQGTAIADGYLGTGINATKLADGTITNTELQYINTLSSNAQTQIDAKSATAGNGSLVTVGALDSGSITSGFGTINNGSSTITTTGAVSTGAITATSCDVAGGDIDNVQNLIHDTSVTTTALDFDADQLQTISISAATTFTTSNLAIGRSKTVKITTDGTDRAFTFPAWKFVGAEPTEQAASKVGILTLTSFGTTDADVVCAYAVEA